MINDKQILFRCIILIIVSIIAVVLFLGNYQNKSINGESKQHELTAIAKLIDAEVDSILIKYQIDIKKVQKRSITIPSSNLNRIERRVTIPSSIEPLNINQELNSMARQYDGIAIGSENLKEQTTAIHMKIDGYIIETIFLKSIKEFTKEKQTIKQKKR